VPQKPYTKTIAYEKSGHFSNLERKIFVSKKKVLQPKSISKKKNLVLRVWFALLNYKKTRNNPEFQLPTFFHQFSYFVKNQIKFPFQMSKYKKKMKKKHSHAYISKKKKKEIKKTSIAPAAVISQKKNSL